MKRQDYLIQRRLARCWAGPRETLDALTALLWLSPAGCSSATATGRCAFCRSWARSGCLRLLLQARRRTRRVRAAQFAGLPLRSSSRTAGLKLTATGPNARTSQGKSSPNIPQFNPWVYSFNVLLPVVDLQQERSWVPMQKEVSFMLGGSPVTVPGWGTNAIVLG